MKNFCAKITVKTKPAVKNIKSLTLKQAIDALMPVKNLCCETGVFYVLKFSAKTKKEAFNTVKKISEELLSNEVIETYEIKNLEEVYE